MLGNERLSRVTWHCIARKILNAQLKLACLSNRRIKVAVSEIMPTPSFWFALNATFRDLFLKKKKF